MASPFQTIDTHVLNAHKNWANLSALVASARIKLSTGAVEVDEHEELSDFGPEIRIVPQGFTIENNIGSDRIAGVLIHYRDDIRIGSAGLATLRDIEYAAWGAVNQFQHVVDASGFRLASILPLSYHPHSAVKNIQTRRDQRERSQWRSLLSYDIVASGIHPAKYQHAPLLLGISYTLGRRCTFYYDEALDGFTSTAGFAIKDAAGNTLAIDLGLCVQNASDFYIDLAVGTVPATATYTGSQVVSSDWALAAATYAGQPISSGD